MPWAALRTLHSEPTGWCKKVKRALSDVHGSSCAQWCEALSAFGPRCGKSSPPTSGENFDLNHRFPDPFHGWIVLVPSFLQASTGGYIMAWKWLPHLFTRLSSLGAEFGSCGCHGSILGKSGSGAKSIRFEISRRLVRAFCECKGGFRQKIIKIHLKFAKFWSVRAPTQ